MQLQEFNTAPPDRAAAMVRSCADVERWVAAVVAGRPYASVDALAAAAEQVADPWTAQEIDVALARHPRIGDRPRGADAESAMSRREQGSVAAAGSDVQQRLAEGNRAYEDRFGHVFLVRAAGRTAEEILDQLQERLTNDAAEERENAARNLREIAVLRLRGMVTP